MEPLRERALCSDLGDGRWGTGRRDAGWRYGESGGRRPAASRSSRRRRRRRRRRGGRRGAAAAAAGRPQSLISQSDLRVTPAHNAIQHQLFPTRAALLFRFTGFDPALKPFFRLTLRGSLFELDRFWCRLEEESCVLWRVVWWVGVLMPASRFYLILSHSDHSSFSNSKYFSFSHH